MSKSNGKRRLNTTIDTELLKEFKILAVQEDKRYNQLLEESIRDVLIKYKKTSSLAAKSSFTNKKKREQEKPAPNLPSLQSDLQGEETAIREMVRELKETRRAIGGRSKKVYSMTAAFTSLVVGLIVSGVFFTTNYSNLLRHKFDLDARAIMLSRSEDYTAKVAKVGVVANSITEQQGKSRELRPVRIDSQTQLLGLQPKSTGRAGAAFEFESGSPTTPVTSARILPVTEIPAPGELFSCKLSAIAWDENPNKRLAVVDERILHESDLVGEATVLRINPDHVVFSDRGEVYIKKINTEE